MILRIDANTSEVATTNSYQFPLKPAIITIDVDNFAYRSELQEIISHELYHFIERIILVKQNVAFFEQLCDWSTYNPTNFDYYNSQTDKTGVPYDVQDRDYTSSYENDMNNVYFTREYAKVYPSEDRACIFEVLLTSERDQPPECFESGYYP